MLFYNLADLSFLPTDKGLDFATPLDDPFNGLFDQYVSQDSSSSSDNVSEPIDFGLLGFPGDEDRAYSGSYIADQPASNFAQPRGGRLHRSPHIAFPITRSSEPVLQRRHHGSAHFDRPTAAISGTELLSLEGKLPHRAPSTQQRPLLPGAPALPLRRKPKFTPESLRFANHRVSKSITSIGGDSPTMIRPSQYSRQETPEWTNRFEQISLQSPSFNIPLSSNASTAIPRDQGIGPTLPQMPSHNGRQVDLNRNTDIGRSSSVDQKTEPGHVTSPLVFLANNNLERNSRHLSQDQATARHGLPSTWSQTLSGQEDFDFTISPKNLEQDWSQDLLKTSGPYYGNSDGIQSAPALSQPDSSFSNEGLLVHCNSFGQFITEDPSEDYLVTGMDPFKMPANDFYRPSLPASNSAQRASTPSSRSSSVCPSPTQSAKPPAKTRKHSKSSRRKSSAGALKSPKSAGALGFVNFTPSDSQKILTGVAPSGSSKTKARRELEANERKKRLSIAAEKAVRDAGGDPEKLRAAGLI